MDVFQPPPLFFSLKKPAECDRINSALVFNNNLILISFLFLFSRFGKSEKKYNLGLYDINLPFVNKIVWIKILLVILQDRSEITAFGWFG